MATAIELPIKEQKDDDTNVSLREILEKIVTGFKEFKNNLVDKEVSPESILESLVSWIGKINNKSDSFQEHIENIPNKYLQIVTTWIQDQIELIDVIIKSIRYDYYVSEERKDRDFKLEQARFNQILAQHYTTALALSGEKRLAAQFLSGLVSALARLPIDHVEMYSMLNNGARAQAGICNTLSQKCDIVLPDTSEKSNDVENWDLRGVDCVLITEKEVLLIDAKSRASYSAVVEVEELQVGDRRDIAYEALVTLYGQRGCDRLFGPDYLRSDKFSNLSIRHLEVTVPTNPEHMSRLGELDSHHQQELMEALDLI